MGIKSDAQSVFDGALAWSQFQVGSSDLDDDLIPSPLDVLPVGVCVGDARTIVYGNRAAAELLGRQVKSGLALTELAERHAIYQAGTDELYPTDSLPLVRAAHGDACSADDLELRRGADRVRVTMQAAPLHDRAGRVLFAVATLRENAAPEPARDSQTPGSEVRVARNLEAIGQLAAGVAHEINTPMQYIGDNTAFLDVTVRRLLDLAGSFENLIGVCRSGGRPSEQLLRECERALSQRRISFLRKQAPAAIEQTVDGIDQVRTIVQALKEFSHPGEDEAVPVDINRLVKMASTVTRNAWRYVATLQLELGQALPSVSGHPQELGQVLINLIVNAAHAIEERLGSEGDRQIGTLTLRTLANGDDVEIEVGDDGAGIPEAVRDRIMDPFFTTKPAGKGTGQGLPLVQRVVVGRHRGRLSFESEVGVGTTFHIVLPGRRDD
ncbi:MAG TPA: ATP-binding protein [Polyangiaceae bacterium]|nr:ATP-binding protein [Polyangiaceae bacterium]